MDRQEEEVNKNGELEIVSLTEIRNKISADVEGDVIEEGKDVTDGPNRRQRNVSEYYQSKKLMAEGMMDLSLLTANANQLKFILYFNKDARTFYPALVLIILSLILQVAVGILLIFRRRFKSSGQKQRASLMKEYLVLLIFLTTLINILVAVFSPVDTTMTQRQQ